MDAADVHALLNHSVCMATAARLSATVVIGHGYATPSTTPAFSNTFFGAFQGWWMYSSGTRESSGTHLHTKAPALSHYDSGYNIRNQLHAMADTCASRQEQSRTVRVKPLALCLKVHEVGERMCVT